MTLYNSGKEIKEMTFEDFKDWLFEVLNDLDNDILVDIKTNDKADTFELIMVGGDVFEIECRETKS
jgi:hypothetical protein